METLHQLVQGSAEWHEHRAQYRNASETPAVLGVSPWQSPYDLWLIKTGRKVVEDTPAMQYGRETEPLARLAFEAATGLITEPKVVVDAPYSASLDGATFDLEYILEIKCPFLKQASELWQSMSQGVVPEHYLLQVQHQLMVSNARYAYLWVYDGNNGMHLKIDPDISQFVRIRQGWESFQPYLENDTPPPLTESDTVIRDDPAWAEVAESYRGWKSVVDEAQAKADAAKAKLITMTDHSKESGCGVTVTRYWKQGSIDYKRIPELLGVDLEQYRGKAREEIRVSVIN